MRGGGRAVDVGRWMAVGLVGIVLTVAMAAPASASASAFDCSGGTIYSLQRPNSQSSSTSGVVFGLHTNTVGSSSVTATQATALPGNSYANALGVTGDGSHMYAVQQSGSAGSATVWSYDTSTATWTSYSGTGGTPSGFVAGAIDPVNGIYYYADYTAGTASMPGAATLYGFDTDTDTPIPGVIATFPLPDGNGTAAQNGDFAFDQSGNLYVLASTGATRALGVVKAPLPTTSSGATLTDTTLSSVSDTSTYNGIAFDATGRLYLESSTSGGTWQITGVDPNNGAICLRAHSDLGKRAVGQRRRRRPGVLPAHPDPQRRDRRDGSELDRRSVHDVDHRGDDHPGEHGHHLGQLHRGAVPVGGPSDRHRRHHLHDLGDRGQRKHVRLRRELLVR